MEGHDIFLTMAEFAVAGFSRDLGPYLIGVMWLTVNSGFLFYHLVTLPLPDRSSEQGVTHFEYIAAAFSIVLALSIARCLDAVAAAFDPSRRYWVHFTWLMVKLANPVVFWWSMWEFRESQDWTFFSFLSSMLVVGTLYLQVNTSVTTSPDSVLDWRSHYYAKHRLFFGANVFLLFQIFIGGQLAMDESFLNPWAIVQMTMIVLSTPGMISKKPTVHAWVAVLGALNMFVVNFGVIAGRSMAG